MNYLLDTNVISELVKSKPNKKMIEWIASIPADSLYVSALTLGEIRKGIEKLSDKSRKEKLCQWLENELATWFGNRVKSIDMPIADCWGRLEAEMKKSLPVIDALLAATALQCDFTLVTRNVSDFRYPLLRVINPWE